MNDDRIQRLEHLSYLSDWFSVVSNLCLDIVVPLHREMGLILPNSDTLPQVFRQGILKVQKQGRIDGPIVEEFKSNIRSGFGAEGLQRFSIWFFTIYRSAPGWSEWQSVWELADFTYYESLMADCDINASQISLLKEYDDRCYFWTGNPEDPATRLLQQLQEGQLSSWDRRYILENKLRIRAAGSDPFTEEADVFTDVKSAISMNRFQMGWETLWSNFTERQKSGITEAGETLLNRVSGGRRKYLVPHPDTIIRYCP